MRALHSRLVIILSSLLLVACATPPSIYQTLSASAHGSLPSTDVVLPIRQSEIYVFVPMATGGAGFGLIGALIDVSVDNARTSKAETAVTALRDAVVDYSFDNAVQDDLKSSLAQLDWLHAGNFKVVRDVSNDGLGKTLTASQASSVLFVVADYHLSNDGDAMLVTFQVALMPNNEQLRAMISGKARRQDAGLAAQRSLSQPPRVRGACERNW